MLFGSERTRKDQEGGCEGARRRSVSVVSAGRGGVSGIGGFHVVMFIGVGDNQAAF